MPESISAVCFFLIRKKIQSRLICRMWIHSLAFILENKYGLSVIFGYLRIANEFVNKTKDLTMKVFLFSLIAGMFIIIAGFKVNQEPKPWPVPDKDAKTP